MAAIKKILSVGFMAALTLLYFQTMFIAHFQSFYRCKEFQKNPHVCLFIVENTEVIAQILCHILCILFNVIELRNIEFHERHITNCVFFIRIFM